MRWGILPYRKLRNNMQKTHKATGFTIIEAVLVLAVAGLIFLMVFVALPALQRSQRDSQRKQDMQSVVAAIINYQASNGGSLPGGDTTTYWKQNTEMDIDSCSENISCEFVKDYLNSPDATQSAFKDPDGTRYVLGFFMKDKNIDSILSKGTTTGSNYYHMIIVKKGVKCGATSSTRKYESDSDSPNAFVVLYKPEGTDAICLDNE